MGLIPFAIAISHRIVFNSDIFFRPGIVSDSYHSSFSFDHAVL